eukprot:scaffold123850_cov56-Attheya_sp.AAC.2
MSNLVISDVTTIIKYLEKNIQQRENNQTASPELVVSFFLFHPPLKPQLIISVTFRHNKLNRNCHLLIHGGRHHQAFHR